MENEMVPVIVVHGGASSAQVPGCEWESNMQGVRQACRAGAKILLSGGSAEDAVTQAILVMEEHPLFDAGYGSHLDQRGRVVLDASLMRGEDLAYAGLIGMERCRNPILVARRLLDDPDLVMLHGEGADQYAQEHGFPPIENSELVSPREQERFAQMKEAGYTGGMRDFLDRRPLSDTVGAVAMDQKGRLAAGNSTGGTPFKKHGRVGDTPLPGCGAIAEDPLGAVCCTGWGEAITRVTLASRVLQMVASGLSPEEAVQRGVHFFLERTQSECGVLCIDGKGSLGVAFNSPQMPWAALLNDGTFVDSDTWDRKVQTPQ